MNNLVGSVSARETGKVLSKFNQAEYLYKISYELIPQAPHVNSNNQIIN